MYNNVVMHGSKLPISQLLGHQCAELAQGTRLLDLEASYRESLQQSGVVFPTAEERRLKQKWTAYWNLESNYLTDEGEIAPTRDLDVNDAEPKIVASYPAFTNANRLNSLTELGIIASAGILAMDQISGRLGEGSTQFTAWRQLMGDYKYFAQSGIAVEEWGQPWQSLVEHSFSGWGLRFPLLGEEVHSAIDALYNPYFTDLRKQHFARLGEFYLTINKALYDLRPKATPSQCHFAAQAGLFYRCSPKGSDDFVAKLIAKGTLPKEPNWHKDIHTAVHTASFVISKK